MILANYNYCRAGPAPAQQRNARTSFCRRWALWCYLSLLTVVQALEALLLNPVNSMWCVSVHRAAGGDDLP
ncbi:hypothetical protein Naga_100001g98 [Nannochloropsis gaditana]|uniref:Uncharacterized protein n=1 Tax=Nannochloropsis gaditana TaxID=72520 RepID=W7TKP0_9STRA|nr:hypothetical protein Naga_100001g98 [Nannochloropsis gaditana]